MILDSSALIAILRDEPEALTFSVEVQNAACLRLSAASYVEVAIVVERMMDPVLPMMFEEFLKDLEIRIEPVTAEQAAIAVQAFRVFGKGRHAAGLNFGDCFTYALAKVMREPVLYKGDDFSQTDLIRAL